MAELSHRRDHRRVHSAQPAPAHHGAVPGPGLHNVEVITRDVNQLELPTARFDRCVSVEMFEHVRNYERLLARISQWLKPDARCSCTSSPTAR